ncbi:MAG: DUF2141 domain-containing protein [Sphingomicrobium sp.]
MLVTGASAARPAIVGKDAAACTSGKPAMLVRVSGFKRATGILKVGVYESDRYLARKGTVRKVKIPVHSTGPLDVCLALPGPGRYAVAVHHDLNANGEKDRSDGGGYSGNPRLSITNLKPSFNRTAVSVGGSPQRVGVQLQYFKGLAIRPINS